MRQLICIVNLLAISLLGIAQSDKRLQAIEDLNGSGQKDKIQLLYEDETFYLKIDSDSVDLQAKTIETIIDNNNKDHVFLFLDLDNNGHKEIAVCTESPIFEHRSLLKIFKYEKHSIKSMPFYYSAPADSSFFDGLVSVEGINIIDSTNKNIYVMDSKLPYLSRNGKTTEWLYGVSCYRWDADIGKIVLYGKKYFKGYDVKHIKELIWYTI